MHYMKIRLGNLTGECPHVVLFVLKRSLCGNSLSKAESFHHVFAISESLQISEVSE